MILIREIKLNCQLFFHYISVLLMVSPSWNKCILLFVFKYFDSTGFKCLTYILFRKYYVSKDIFQSKHCEYFLTTAIWNNMWERGSYTVPGVKSLAGVIRRGKSEESIVQRCYHNSQVGHNNGQFKGTKVLPAKSTNRYCHWPCIFIGKDRV